MRKRERCSSLSHHVCGAKLGFEIQTKKKHYHDCAVPGLLFCAHGRCELQFSAFEPCGPHAAFQTIQGTVHYISVQMAYYFWLITRNHAAPHRFAIVQTTLCSAVLAAEMVFKFNFQAN